MPHSPNQEIFQLKVQAIVSSIDFSSGHLGCPWNWQIILRARSYGL